MSMQRKVALGAAAFTYMFLSMQAVLADDTEIYLTRELSADQRVRPNILFVIDTSGSMRSNGVPGTNCKSLVAPYINKNGLPVDWCRSTKNNPVSSNNEELTRLEVVKQVVTQLTDELALSDDTNIGLARFSSDSDGGFINVPVERASTVKGNFQTQLYRYSASGGTPLLESYHEAARYLRGETPLYGKDTKGYIIDLPLKNNSVPTTSIIDKWKSDSASIASNGSYISPITNSCQKTNIILLTDGLPNSDSSSNDTIENLVSGVNKEYTACNRGYPTDNPKGPYDGCWLPGLAEYLANQDNSPLSGKQEINTFTVGFGDTDLDKRMLTDAANLGKGKFFLTTSTSELVTSLRSIIVDILAENTTFTTPTVSVSAYSNFGYRNDLYYALFRPADGARWVGNIKKYKAISDTNGNLIVADQTGANAIDSATGFFSDSAKSYWSTAVDGKNAESGGAASRLTDPTIRKLYTYAGNNLEPGTTTPVNLTSSNDTALSTSNTKLTKTLLGDATMADAYKTNLISWARGTNPADGLARKQIADVLHNSPKVVAYVSDEDLERVGNGNAQDKLALFYGTNEGFIGAINPDTGNEYFAFVPKELLPNLKAYYDDPKGSVNKRYGVDGQFGLKVSYGTVNTTTKLRPVSEVLLYAGMGRGGNNYYALDMTPAASGDPATIQPKLKWVIRGGPSGSTGFTRLGQTWSTPKVAKVMWDGVAKDVLIFTGGYDTNQDDDTPNTPTADTIGNALFVVDADTGAKLWMAGPSSDSTANLKLSTLTNSMPADPALVDISGDGIIDTIFTADTRGQVFRFDISASNTSASNFATGGRIAQFGGSTAQNNRRFYNQPDVALIKERGGKTYFTISLGSGYRGHPLNEDTIDRFYVIKDSYVYAKPSTYTTLTESSLVDVSSVTLTGAQAIAIQAQIDTKRAQIDAFTAAETAARSNFDTYKQTVGFTAKQEALIQTNTEMNQKQAAIESITINDPYVVDHAAEANNRNDINNLIISALDGLKALSGLTPAPGSNAEIFLADQLDNSSNVDWGSLLTNLQTVEGSTNDTKYSAVLAAEDAEIAARPAVSKAQTDVDDAQQVFNDVNSDPLSTPAEIDDAQTDLDDAQTALDLAQAPLVELDAAITTYETDQYYLERQSLVDQQVSINTQLAAILAQQQTIYSALQADDLADVTAEVSALNALKDSLALAIYPAVTDNSPASNADLLADESSTRQNQIDVAASGAPLIAGANLKETLEAERAALAVIASGLNADLQALSDAPYVTGSNLLTGAQLSDAITSDTSPPLSMFDAYDYLVVQAQANAASGIPILRDEINVLYAQLTPGDDYVPNTTALASSSGWFLRFPIGEKVLSSSISFRGSVLFTTFRPSGSTVTTCGPDVGSGRFYALNLKDATAVFTQTVNGVTTPKRSFDLAHGGIPPKPAIILREGEKPGCLVGAEGCTPQPTECVDGSAFCEASEPVKKTYWREN